MNTFAVLAVVALMVYSASATPCSDTCEGSCGLASQFGAVAAPPFAPIIQTVAAFCTQGCAVGCGCVDQCYNQCTQQTTQCVGDNTNNPFVGFFCAAQFPGCKAYCMTQCSFNVVTGVVQQFAAAASGGAQ